MIKNTAELFVVFAILGILVPATLQADEPVHYLVSLGEYGNKGEVTGYECNDEDICRIKLLTSKNLIVIANIWFINKMAFILFKTNVADDKYFYFHVAGAHQDEQQYLAMKLKESDCVKEPAMLFGKALGLRKDLMCDNDCLFAKINVTICAKK